MVSTMRRRCVKYIGIASDSPVPKSHASVGHGARRRQLCGIVAAIRRARHLRQYSQDACLSTVREHGRAHGHAGCVAGGIAIAAEFATLQLVWISITDVWSYLRWLSCPWTRPTQMYCSDHPRHPIEPPMLRARDLEFVIIMACCRRTAALRIFLWALKPATSPKLTESGLSVAGLW
jgi:hypothetical protein